MDPRDPSQRPSIFKAPEPIEERPAPKKEPAPDFWNDPPMTRRSAEPEPVVPSGPSRRLVMGASFGGALVLLVIGGLVVGAILRSDDEVPTGAVSPSATPSAPSSVSPSSSALPTATASPTPVPTPAGPPQEIPVGAWATVAVDELNVRSAAGADSSSNYLLVRGSVVHVAEGPTIVADLNWYRIASLGGATGWVTSGWVAEPFMTTLVEDPTLIRCGEVGAPVFDLVNGEPTPHDPISIGDLALPAAAFSNLSLGAIELLRGVGAEACFSAQLGSNGVPVVSAQLSVSACGHPARDGNLFRLRPAAGQNVPGEAQVKDPAIVHPAILVGTPPEDRRSSNLRSILTLASGGADATVCMNVSVMEGAGGVDSHQAVDTSQCTIVHEHTNGNIKLSLASGGDTVWIKLTEDLSQLGIFPLEVPVPVYLSANASNERRDAYAYQGYVPSCS